MGNSGGAWAVLIYQFPEEFQYCNNTAAPLYVAWMEALLIALRGGNYNLYFIGEETETQGS